MIVKIAETEFEKEQSFILAFRRYLKECHINKNDFPDSRMKDLFDDRPDTIIFIAISKSGQVVGTLRLVRDNPELSPRLPIERSFNLDLLPIKGEQLGELCRFAVESRGMTAFYLIKLAMLYAEQIGVTHFVISCSILQAKHYASFGFKQVGREYYYVGIRHEYPSITMLVNLQEAVDNMYLTNPLFDRIYKKENNSILLPSYVGILESPKAKNIADIDEDKLVKRTVLQSFKSIPH